MNIPRKGRGPFYITRQGSLVRVDLCNPQSPESELILCLNKDYIPNLIATLRMLEEE